MEGQESTEEDDSTSVMKDEDAHDWPEKLRNTCRRKNNERMKKKEHTK